MKVDFDVSPFVDFEKNRCIRSHLVVVASENFSGSDRFIEEIVNR